MNELSLGSTIDTDFRDEGDLVRKTILYIKDTLGTLNSPSNEIAIKKALESNGITREKLQQILNQEGAVVFLMVSLRDNNDFIKLIKRVLKDGVPSDAKEEALEQAYTVLVAEAKRLINEHERFRHLR